MVRNFGVSAKWFIPVIFGVIAIWSISATETTTPTPYLLEVPDRFPEPFPTKNSPTHEGVALGRYLFYDPILSANRDLACGGCHNPEAAFSDSPKDFSTGANGTKMTRNTPALFNLAWYSSFFLDGRAKSLEDQVFHPVRAHDEMNLDWPTAVERLKNSEFYPTLFHAAFPNSPIDSLTVALAIAQFERTLISADTKYDRVFRGEAYFTPEEYAGFVAANDQVQGACIHCHPTDAGALTTNGRFSNIGLDSVGALSDYVDRGRAGVTGDNRDVGAFRVPSLRNLVFTAPYMHDGRFETLEEVLDFYSEGVHAAPGVDPKMQFAQLGGAHLSEEQKSNIIRFLLTLTDSSFVSNPAFDNPFPNQ